MKRKIICLSALLVTAFVSCLGAFLLKSFGEATPPIGLGIADPLATAEQFCSALDDGDMETVASLLNGSPSIVPDFGSDTSIEYTLYDNMIDSISCSLSSKGTVNGMNAHFDVDAEYFSVFLAIDDINRYTGEYYDEMLANVQDNDQMYDTDGNLLESAAMDLYEKAVNQILKDTGDYIVNKSISLDLVYVNKRWEVILTDDLAEVLLCKAEN